MADVRKLLKALAERALRPTVDPADEQRGDRLTDALAALRILVDNWDDLFLGGTPLAAGLTPTPHPRSISPRASAARTPGPRSAFPPRPDEITLLALLAEHDVKLNPMTTDSARGHLCRQCGQPLRPGEDALVYTPPNRSPATTPYDVATHLKCRWWWWDSEQSPIRPSR